MRRRRFYIWLLAFCAVLLVFGGTVCIAETGELGTMPEDFGTLSELLDGEAEALLPEGLDSSDPQIAGAAVERMVSPDYLLGVLSDLTGAGLRDAARLLGQLCGLLILAAIFGTLRRSLGSDTLSAAVRFCTTAAIFAAILHLQSEHLARVALFFDRLCSLMGAMIPIAGTLWAMGGNVTTASAGTATLSVFLTVCQRLCAETILPVCGICTALALCNTLSPETGLRGMGGTVKKLYTFSLGMIMTLLVASLGSQTTLTAAADSTAARAARVVSSNIIPVVGGSVGDTLRTVASGVGYLKSVVGIGGIVFLLLLLLPTLLSLLLTRLAFLLGSGVADLLGCETEGKLLSELGSVWGCMIAVVAMSSVMFILGLTIFVKTTVAAA
ncbi:MAG: hypothetical protein E7668_04875 [Ruminococcaceae bacterium]|nr:hypothetical protein [Oscillospiraceae bacterium]